MIDQYSGSPAPDDARRFEGVKLLQNRDRFRRRKLGHDSAERGFHARRVWDETVFSCHVYRNAKESPLLQRGDEFGTALCAVDTSIHR